MEILSHEASATAPPGRPRLHAADRAGVRLRLGDCVLDLEQRRLCRADGSEVEITVGEYDMLALLAGHADRALSREALLEGMHQLVHPGAERAIDLRVMRLRRKIERDPARPEVLVTVRRRGYMLVAGGPTAVSA